MLACLGARGAVAARPVRSRPTTRGRGSSGAARSRDLDLSTTSGPSWKPLPVLFTTPFALFGDDAAPDLWLLVARAGGLLAIAMAYRLGSRLGGRAAGVIAAAALLLADEFVRNFARGNSEGLLVALCLWAVERHLDGRRSDAFLLGFAAGAAAPRGVAVLRALRALARVDASRAGARSCVGVLRAQRLSLWFVPEYWGSGDWLRAADRAHQPNPDSAAFADRPFLEVFRRSAPILIACRCCSARCVAVVGRAAASGARDAARARPPPRRVLMIDGGG